ncbi:MAG TPA: helix-turn-helix transcriptional regulator [Vicinamibacterales bacterium]|nr:helix-turn-helix transcriptional regulator [Vicinamibacterales bacterium]
MTLPEEDFGARLRQQRERRGISLAAVADALKIKRSLLADLERGDLSHWPAGIFRRAFLREYAEAIGASPADTVSECLRLFPEPGNPPRSHQGASPELRLTMATPARHVELRRLSAVLIDTLIVAAVAAIASRVSQVDLWKMGAVCAMVYYGVATIWIGKSPASKYLGPRRGRRSLARRSRRRAARHAVEATTSRSGLIVG